MQIPGVLAGLPDAMRQPRPDMLSPIAGEKSSRSESASAARPARLEAIREVLGRFDVTDITPADFSEMTHRLHEAGVITQSELQELAVVRLDLEQAGIESDESIDLLDFYTRRIEKAQRRLNGHDDPAAAREQLGPMIKRLEWIEKLAVLHDTADELGLDALA